MARTYIIEIYDLRKDLELWRIKRDNEWRMVFNAFLAGLKAGKDIAETDLATIAYIQGAERYKPKWHKVADGDLPPVQKGYRYSANIFTDEGDIAYYDPTFNTWWYAYEQTGLASLEIDPPPIAWCEIPTYTEE